MKEGMLFDKTLNGLIYIPPGLNIEEIIIPDGVEIIGEELFASHPSISSLQFPSTLKKISSKSFYSNNKLQLPDV
jgi:hypothetical protein